MHRPPLWALAAALLGTAAIAVGAVFVWADTKLPHGTKTDLGAGGIVLLFLAAFAPWSKNSRRKWKAAAARRPDAAAEAPAPPAPLRAPSASEAWVSAVRPPLVH